MDGRRRTTGLRREEVAVLANVSVSWYTFLEQGREVNPSAQVLDGVSRALGLTSAERDYLYWLAGKAPPADEQGVTDDVSDITRALLRALQPNPAYVISRYWDILAWNEAMAALMTVDFAAIPVAQRNVLWILFTVPEMRQLFAEWESEVRRLLGVFRAAVGPGVTDPRAAQIASALTAASPEFRAWWPSRNVHQFQSRWHEFNHPVAGHLTMQYAKLDLAESHGASMMVHLPATPSDEARLARLAATCQPGEPTGPDSCPLGR
jgi:transcriptional regulator with XRE-family HTH domain